MNMYTGMRYVPKIESDENPWLSTKEYEYLTVVQYQGNSYTSRQNVPSGIDINNKTYWACTGNYNAQTELYRQETREAVKEVTKKLDSFSNVQDGKFQILLNKYKAEINSYADGKYSDINNEITVLNDKIGTSKSELNSAISKANDDLNNTVTNYKGVVDDQIVKVQTIISSIDLIFDSGSSTDVEDEENITIVDGNGGI